MKNKYFLSLFYVLLSLFIGWILAIVLSTHFDLIFFGYKAKPYNHELDFLFSFDEINEIEPNYVYKIHDESGIYFMSHGQNKFVIIESSSFSNIDLEKTITSKVISIKPTDNKTYKLYFHTQFPIIEQVLRPTKSIFLNILIAGNYEVEEEIRTKKTLYLSGSFSSLSFSNTQNCSMISFPESKQNDVVVTKHNNKLYFIVHAREDKTILDFLNPALLKDDG